MTIDDIRVLVKTDESRILELKESAGELKECRACDEDFFRMEVFNIRQIKRINPR